MKVQIETTVNGNGQSIRDFNWLLLMCLSAKNLTALKGILGERKCLTIKWGFGSSHFWAKQTDINGNSSDDRILFIEEN